MKFIKVLLLVFSVFFILVVPFSLKADEKDVIKEWIEEDVAEAVIDRLEKLEAQRETTKFERSKIKIKYLYREAKELIKLKKYDEARQKYQEILRLNPGERKAREYIAKIDKIQEVTREREIKRVVTQKEREEKEKFKKFARDGADLYHKKQYAAAREKWEEALRYDPGNESIQTWVKRARIREAEMAREEMLFEKGLEEKAALAAIDEAYLPKRREGIRREKLEEEMIAREEEKKKKIEEMLETIEIAELHLKDADLRHVINKITSMSKVTILVDWTAISEATGISPRPREPAEEGEEEGEIEEAPLVEIGEIKTMHLDLEIYNPMPLKAFLDYLMKITRLKYRVEEHAILISTREALEKEEMVVKVYKLKYGMTKLRPVTLRPLGREED